MAKNRSIRRSRSNYKPVLYFDGRIIGLVISDSVDDVVKKSDSLETVPNVIFYDNDTKVVFDYSHASEKDLKVLDVFFGELAVDGSFTIDSETAYYIKERGTKIDADLSGSYTLISFQGSTVTAQVTSVTRKDSKVNNYESKYFTTVPRLSKTDQTTTKDQLFELRNQSGPNSKFSFRNARPILRGDLIEFKTPLNNGRFFVDSYRIEDGVEIISLRSDTKLSSEILIGDPTNVRLYRTGYSESQLDVKLQREVRSLRRESDVVGGRGTCCLYVRGGERIEDSETGHVFNGGEVYSCGCRDDWECVFLAHTMNMDRIFTYQNEGFCESKYDSSCSGFSAFPDSPDDDSNTRCGCCAPTIGGTLLPDQIIEVDSDDPSVVRSTTINSFPEATRAIGESRTNLVSNSSNLSFVSSTSSIPAIINYERDLDQVIQVTVQDEKIVLSSNPVLAAGRSYKFDQSHPSNAGVYISFGDTADSLRNTGRIYSNKINYGTPGTPGAYTILKVNQNKERSSLFYFNASTPNMGGELTVGSYSPNPLPLRESKIEFRRPRRSEREEFITRVDGKISLGLGSSPVDVEGEIGFRSSGTKYWDVEIGICTIVLPGCIGDFRDDEKPSIQFTAKPYPEPYLGDPQGCLSIMSIGLEKCPDGGTRYIYIVKNRLTGKRTKVSGPCCKDDGRFFDPTQIQAPEERIADEKPPNILNISVNAVEDITTEFDIVVRAVPD